jgi:ubiquitin carboxyl-terminal hydrolase 25/28
MNLIGSDKKYIDPTEVVKSICDDFGNHLPIGD